MATVSKKHTFTAGTTILSAQVNENFDDIYNEFNGGITNDNINGSAAIADSKLAQITSSGKVDGTTAITGLIPSANQDTVAAVTDAATITTDASAGTIFKVTITDNRTLDAPTNAVDGMKRIWRIKQDGTGGHTLTLNAIFRISSDVPASGQVISISTTASETSYIGAIYNGDDTKWDVVSLSRGHI